MSAEYRPAPTLLEAVGAEMRRQRVKWGEQNHPDLSPTVVGSSFFAREKAAAAWLGIPTEPEAKRNYETAMGSRRLDWSLILVEEVAEAVAAAARGDTDALKTELVQVAAVCLSWVEAIGRRAP